MMREHPELDTAENRQTLQHFQQLAGGGNDDAQLHVIEMEMGPNGQLQDTETKGILAQTAGGFWMIKEEDPSKVMGFTEFVDINGKTITSRSAAPSHPVEVKNKAERQEKYYVVSYRTNRGLYASLCKFRAKFAADVTHIEDIEIVEESLDDVLKREDHPSIVIQSVSIERYETVLKQDNG